MKKFSAIAVVLMLVLSSVIIPISADESANVVAHWKLQNEKGYFTGKILNDDLTFIDLTGNGNDLVTAVVGNGNELEIFDWDDGANIGASVSESSLYMANSLANAKSVDPHEADKTSWTGGYTSGKYLETVENAPMNSMDFANGFTIEIIFKVSPEFNSNYNRYTGLFSRQGVSASANEPPLSLALTENSGDADGSMGDSGTIGLQYVHLDADEVKTNNEYVNGTLAADTWHHFMVTSEGDLTEIYIDGENYDYISETAPIFIKDKSYSWEVGVGRKDGAGHVDVDTMNENYPEGLIRRLFCGSISEIRVCDGYMPVEESLFSKAVSYDVAEPEPEPEPAPEPAPAPVESPEPAAEPEPAPAEQPAEEIVEAAAPVITAPQTFDIGVISAVCAVITGIGYMVSKKR